MGRQASLEQLGQFARKTAKLQALIDHGTRDAALVNAALQRLIEGDFPGTDPRDETFGLWTPVREYAERLWVANRRYNWQLSDFVIDPLRGNWSWHCGRLQPTGLELWLGSAAQTFRALLQWIQDEQVNLGLPPIRCNLEMTEDNLRVGASRFRSEPIRSPDVDFSRLDFARINDQTDPPPMGSCNVLEAREQKDGNLPGLEVLALLALNPRAMPYIMGANDELPEIVLGGLEYHHDPAQPWGHVLVIRRHAQVSPKHSWHDIQVQPANYSRQFCCIPVRA